MWVKLSVIVVDKGDYDDHRRPRCERDAIGDLPELMSPRPPRSHLPVRGRLGAALAAAIVLAGCGSSGTSSSTSSTVARQPVASQKHSVADPHDARSKHARNGAQAVPSTSSTKHSQAVARPAVRSKHARNGAQAVPSTSSTKHSQAVARPAVRSKPPVISAGAVTRSLSGTGDRAIGALSEKSTVVLEWSTTTPPIQVFAPHGFLLVNSNFATGRVRLARGEYKGLRVATKGHWTIQVRAS